MYLYDKLEFHSIGSFFSPWKSFCFEFKCVKKAVFVSNDCLCGEDGNAHPDLDVGLPLGSIITQRGEEEGRRREGEEKEEGGCLFGCPQGTA